MLNRGLNFNITNGQSFQDAGTVQNNQACEENTRDEGAAEEDEPEGDLTTNFSTAPIQTDATISFQFPCFLRYFNAQKYICCFRFLWMSRIWTEHRIG